MDKNDKGDLRDHFWRNNYMDKAEWIFRGEELGEELGEEEGYTDTNKYLPHTKLFKTNS